MKRNASEIILKLILMVMFTVLVSDVRISVKTVKAQSSPALKVVPQYTTEDMISNSTPITISINVEKVTDLVSWQVVLYYNPSFLHTQTNWLWMPPDNVFDGKQGSFPPPYIGSDSYGSYIMGTFALYYSDTDKFSGSGVLCKINFTAVKPGISHLAFSEDRDHESGRVYINGSIPGYYPSFLLDPLLSDIKATAVEGTVEVRGGYATIYVSPSTSTLTSPPATVGTEFTVDVRIENYSRVTAWQVKLVFDKSLLNVTASDVDYAPDFIFPSGTYSSVPAAIDYLNATHQYVMMTAAAYGLVEYNGTDAGLMQIRFMIISVPPKSSTYSSLLWIEPVDTWTLSRNMEENGEKRFDGYYEIASTSDIPEFPLNALALVFALMLSSSVAVSFAAKKHRK